MRRRPGGDGGTLVGGELGERSLERLAQDAEGEVALDVRAAAGEHEHALGLGLLAHGVHEARLADPRRALDDRQPAVAGPRLGEAAGDPCQLACALEERPLGRRGSQPRVAV